MQRPAFSHLFDDGPHTLRGKISTIFSLLIAANIGVWIWALTALHGRSALIGTALLAYAFGLRHAVDADHIAAIDNTTRKLMQGGKRPVAVGCFFSLGHSTIVLALSVAVAFAAVTLNARFEALKSVGGVISTSVSASFLLVLAIVNVMILVSVVKTFRRVQRGERLVEEDLDMLLNRRGLLSRIFRPLFRLVSRSWHMYPVGFLFGLGFDTATEVALFGMSAAQAADGMSLGTILIFPALFTAGMCLVDTADGVLMLGAYGWAFMKPVRKLYYNITITLVSVVVAVLIGGIEALALVGDKLDLKGGFWDLVGAASDNFGLLGYAVIGIFVLSWLASVAVYKLKRYDEMPVNLG
ncbi:HoxN/HupN/NixA family nickel/cobalt transporter [Paraburkholderia sp. CNPSo 3157]|uniref:Nickel/cobalt efflux system n=1 Tax=Paraburkholderia franconis TaxID=2654983 RepID=A0A7X1TJB6_9BURK|nr:HoxN/HupN/NixA family nickel/cobalt transporter [Paraburkholderia franconis]MPW21552.1 HoxN/HupN/NixA family nickel/cobalt transporter [Paraburkholderia franconis]